MIALLGKSEVFTAVLWAKVHFHRSFAHAIFDKCCRTQTEITKNTRSQNGLDTENVVKPQQKDNLREK